MMKALADELAPYRIRVNAIDPNVDTTMIHNEAIYQVFFPTATRPP